LTGYRDKGKTMLRLLGVLAAVAIFTNALTEVSAAPPRRPVVVESTDKRFVMVSGRDKDEVEVLVQDAAARGHRLVAVTNEWRSWGADGLTCLLERGENEPAPDLAYRLRNPISGLYPLGGKLYADASQGYRLLEWSLLYRHYNYLFEGAMPFWVMERAPQTEPAEYAVIMVQHRKKLLKKLQQHCKRQYRLAAFLGHGGLVTVVMQRSPQRSAPHNSQSCDSERFEFVEAKLEDYPEMADRLDDLAAEGYRLLAADSGGFIRFAFSGAILLERDDGDNGNYEHVFPDPRKGISENLETLNAAAERGFHLHRLTGGLLVMEKAPGSQGRSEYRLITGESAQQMLDAVAAASNDGFRVVRLRCEDKVLMERRSLPTPDGDN